jgi:MFS family permease
VLFVLAFVAMGFANNDTWFIAGVIGFFIAFNMMEPLVQSMISKYAKVHQKGAALGIGNSVAYFATFIGGTLAGLFLDFSDRSTLGGTIAAIGVLWLIWTLRLEKPLQHSHLYTPLQDVDLEKLNALEHDSIAEWYINESEEIAVIKYQKDAITQEELQQKILKG